MRKLLSVVIPLILLASCSKVPSRIIQPDKMADLMADVHTGEAMAEMNRASYPNDSTKQALKQSIYLRHGVTSEQVDSSLAWYGRNITYYMDVYDRTIEILEHRLIESGNRVAAEAALSIAGDSVDVWAGPRFLRIYDRLPSKTVLFNISRDPNWERGDIYTWRVKFLNNTVDAKWQLVAEYADGTLEFLAQTAQGDGWKELSLYTDSLRDATRIYGFIEANNRPGTTMLLDSVEMVRKRVDQERYNRRYTLRKYEGILPAVDLDTLAEQAKETPQDESAEE